MSRRRCILWGVAALAASAALAAPAPDPATWLGASEQALTKTRSGKLLRRALQAVAERRDPGDLTTMDAERINLIGNTLNDLAVRTQELRRYL